MELCRWWVEIRKSLFANEQSFVKLKMSQTYIFIFYSGWKITTIYLIKNYFAMDNELSRLSLRS